MDEGFLVDALRGDGSGEVFLDGEFEILEAFVAQGLAEAFALEVVDFPVAEIAILIFVGQIEYSLQSSNASWLESRLLKVKQRRYGICARFLAEEKDFIDIVVFFCAGSNAGLNLLEVSHDWHYFFVDNAFRADIFVEI